MRDILTTLRLVVLSLLVCCVLYPAVLLGFGQLVVPHRADGSLVRNVEGQVIGSRQIAQGFSSPGYFWPRPSAVDYAADAAGGSNLSPANPAIAERAAAIIDRLAPAPGQRIPADLVTASGSGLDPHITLKAARFQVGRVARARGVPAERVEALIDDASVTHGMRLFGGAPMVNVLELNLLLDRTLGAE